MTTSDVEARARQTQGSSHAAIYAAVDEVLARRGAGGTLADIGCGKGLLWETVRARFTRCVGVDAVRFDGLPADVEFRAVDLDRDPLPLATGETDVAAAVETIEHLENPRAFVRELTRITRPGGLIVITTPNQLSALSLLTLVTKQQFVAFQDNSYPAHRTALLEADLRRIAAECGLTDADVRYTAHGRVPLSASHYPEGLARQFPRWLSDNVVISARKPIA